MPEKRNGRTWQGLRCINADQAHGADATKGFEETEMRRIVADLVGHHQIVSAAELNAGRVILDLARSGNRFGLRLLPELPLLGQTLLNLHHIGRVLDEQFDVNGSMRRNATGLMRSRMLKTVTPAHLLSSAVEIRDFAERHAGTRQPLTGSALCKRPAA